MYSRLQSWRNNQKIANKLQGFPPVYYINLDDQTQRKQSIERQFQDYGITHYSRISAKDGRKSDLRECLTEDLRLMITPPEIGCTLSHLQAIEHWLNTNSSPHAIICEDDLDLSLAQYWQFTWQDFMQHLPPDWDCIQLTIINNLPTQVIRFPLHERYEYDWSTTCYLINRSYAQKLINKHKKGDKYNLSQDFYRPVSDSLMYLNGRTYATNLFGYKVESPSDIQTSDKKFGYLLNRKALYSWWQKNGKVVDIKTFMYSCLNVPPLSDFPVYDKYWVAVKDFLAQHVKPLDPILAPTEFMELHPGVYHYFSVDTLPINHFKFVVFHKGLIDKITPSFSQQVIQNWIPIFANEVFVIYAQNTALSLPEDSQIHLPALLEKVAAMPQPATEDKKPDQVAIVVTTHNRPHCLQRSLPQFVALGVPIVVVDDASTPENSQANQALATQYQVPLIPIPENRGLPNAMNVGISYWLADPDITWISYFQDDVDVHPDTLNILAKIQDPQVRPLLSGHHTPVHPTIEIQEIAGYRVKCKRSTNGLHLHGHRDYWCQVMPIPTPYLGAPKADKGKPGQGSDEDWWIVSLSPNSITKRGGYVICIAGLVETFMLTAEESTWGALNPALESAKL